MPWTSNPEKLGQRSPDIASKTPDTHVITLVLVFLSFVQLSALSYTGGAVSTGRDMNRLAYKMMIVGIGCSLMRKWESAHLDQAIELELAIIPRLRFRHPAPDWVEGSCISQCFCRYLDSSLAFILSADARCEWNHLYLSMSAA